MTRYQSILDNTWNSISSHFHTRFRQQVSSLPSNIHKSTLPGKGIVFLTITIFILLIRISSNSRTPRRRGVKSLGLDPGPWGFRLRASKQYYQVHRKAIENELRNSAGKECPPDGDDARWLDKKRLVEGAREDDLEDITIYHLHAPTHSVFILPPTLIPYIEGVEESSPTKFSHEAFLIDLFLPHHPSQYADTILKTAQQIISGSSVQLDTFRAPFTQETLRTLSCHLLPPTKTRLGIPSALHCPPPPPPAASPDGTVKCYVTALSQVLAQALVGVWLLGLPTAWNPNLISTVREWGRLMDDARDESRGVWGTVGALFGARGGRDGRHCPPGKHVWNKISKTARDMMSYREVMKYLIQELVLRRDMETSEREVEEELEIAAEHGVESAAKANDALQFLLDAGIGLDLPSEQRLEVLADTILLLITVHVEPISRTIAHCLTLLRSSSSREIQELRKACDISSGLETTLTGGRFVEKVLHKAYADQLHLTRQRKLMGEMRVPLSSKDVSMNLNEKLKIGLDIGQRRHIALPTGAYIAFVSATGGEQATCKSKVTDIDNNCDREGLEGAEYKPSQGLMRIIVGVIVKEIAKGWDIEDLGNDDIIGLRWRESKVELDKL